MINRIRGAVSWIQNSTIKKSYRKSGKNRVHRDQRNDQPINFWSAAIRSRSARSRSVDSVISVMVI